MVWFRLSGSLNKFRWLGRSMTISVASPLQLTITVKENTNRQSDAPIKNALVDITHETKVSAQLESDLNGKIERRHIGSFTVKPYSVQDEINRIRLEIQSAATTVINTMRWSALVHGPAEPFAGMMLLYSFDQKRWGLIESNVIYRRNINLPHGYSDEWHARLQGTLDRGETEPVGHDLLRAGWDSCVTNPRASLFLGTAAIEVGTKECIARLVPETSWLVDSLQSPPVFRMIRDYIPKLLAERGNLSAYAPPATFVSVIQRGVEQRNTLVHKLGDSERYGVIPEALEYLNLEELLWTVEDLLWLYDGYCGLPQAFNRVRSLTTQSLIDRHGGQELPYPEYPNQL